VADTNGHEHPAPSDPEVARLLQRLTELASELAMCSAPRVSELTNSLEIFANRARQGDGQAKDMLRRFYKAFDESRSALSGIEIPRGSRKT
jgi:hypothetical protein